VTHEDVRSLLAGFLSAIELDQMRIDALPNWALRAPYDDDLWRGWRRDHIDYLELLLTTVDEISDLFLCQLAEVAARCDAHAIKSLVLDLCSEQMLTAPDYDIASAAGFFSRLVTVVGRQGLNKQICPGQRQSTPVWFDVCDPLRISKDPECSYGTPKGCLN
jgi:hypothetical protein